MDPENTSESNRGGKAKGKFIWSIILLIVVIGLGMFLLKGDRMDKKDMDDNQNEEMVSEEISYSVTINNLSDSQPLSPGVFIVHDKNMTLNFNGKLSPKEFESLSEYGSNTALVTSLTGLPGIARVYAIDAPILPGESTTIEVKIPKEGEFLLSGVQMAVGSNDGFALIGAIRLDGKEITVVGENFDNGTEENTELGSGFEGGQPDPSKGAENIENGTPTDPQAPVSAHPQLTAPIMEVVIIPSA